MEYPSQESPTKRPTFIFLAELVLVGNLLLHVYYTNKVLFKWSILTLKMLNHLQSLSSALDVLLGRVYSAVFRSIAGSSPIQWRSR